MSTIKPLMIAAAVLISLATVGGAQAQSFENRYPCPGTKGDPEKRLVHQTILENAVLAELAYGGSGPATLNLHGVCPSGVSSDGDGMSIQISPVPPSVITQAIDGFSTMEVSYDEDDDRYLSCQSDDSREERIAAAYEFAEVNGQLSFLIKVAIRGAAGTLNTEELAILRLEDDNGHEILGIRGTQFWRPRQWNASVSNLIGSSCLFDFSVEVAKGFFHDDNLSPLYKDMTGSKLINIGRLGVVGHSLGGAVVQHLMVQEDFHKALTDLEEDLAQNGQDGFDFRAYSFNSIGVEEGEVHGRSRMGNLTSVRVAGEILEQIEAKLEGNYSRRQIGHIVRYSTDGRTPLIWDPIEFHKIDAVKRAICECLDGTSSQFEYEFRP